MHHCAAKRELSNHVMLVVAESLKGISSPVGGSLFFEPVEYTIIKSMGRTVYVPTFTRKSNLRVQWFLGLMYCDFNSFQLLHVCCWWFRNPASTTWDLWNRVTSGKKHEKTYQPQPKLMVSEPSTVWKNAVSSVSKKWGFCWAMVYQCLPLQDPPKLRIMILLWPTPIKNKSHKQRVWKGLLHLIIVVDKLLL